MTLLSRRSIMLGIAGALVSRGVPTRAATVAAANGYAFGTHWRVLVHGPAAARHAAALAEATFAQIDRAMSPWDPGSELARFNAHVGTAPVPVSTAFVRVAEAALDTARETGGAFDPTVGPIVGRHGFGPIRSGAAPDWRALSVHPGFLAKSEPGLTVDLCGIAKGHAIDTLGVQLTSARIADWLIDLGGELRARGVHPSGRPWRAAVARPFAADGDVLAVLALDGLAVATSGIAESSYVVGSRRISHLVDPGLRSPIDNRILSSTVVASTAQRADALATALSVMGAERGAAFAEAQGIDAMLVSGNPGAEIITMTGRFDAHRIG